MYKSDEIKKLLGLRIKELRKIKGFTQEELAEKMEIDQRNLSKIECGNNFITAETLSKILSSLDIEPAELFAFKHLQEEPVLKDELIKAIIDNKTDIKLLYQLYQVTKK